MECQAPAPRKGVLLRVALIFLALRILRLMSDDLVLPWGFALVALVLGAVAVLWLPVIGANFLCDSYDAWRRARTE